MSVLRFAAVRKITIEHHEAAVVGHYTATLAVQLLEVARRVVLQQLATAADARAAVSAALIVLAFAFAACWRRGRGLRQQAGESFFREQRRGGFARVGHNAGVALRNDMRHRHTTSVPSCGHHGRWRRTHHNRQPSPLQQRLSERNDNIQSNLLHTQLAFLDFCLLQSAQQ